MAILTLSKAIRSLRKTSLLLRTTLKNVTQEQAVTLKDGPDGWSTLFIVCHLRDYETIYLERARLIRDHDYPTFPATLNNDQMIELHQYAAQQLESVLAERDVLRAQMLALAESLNEDQLYRKGVSTTQGEGTLLDILINAAVHDLDHIEQIQRVLGIN